MAQAASVINLPASKIVRKPFFCKISAQSKQYIPDKLHLKSASQIIDKKFKNHTINIIFLRKIEKLKLKGYVLDITVSLTFGRRTLAGHERRADRLRHTLGRPRRSD